MSRPSALTASKIVAGFRDLSAALASGVRLASRFSVTRVYRPTMPSIDKLRSLVIDPPQAWLDEEWTADTWEL